MSMHEIEDMVTGAIQSLDAHPPGGSIRDLIHALYAFQTGFDCSFTNGRVLDILVKRRFTHKSALADHKSYANNKKAFDKAAKEKSELLFVGRDILESDDEEGIGHEDGYVFDGALYCDLGTPLWEQFVKDGVIKGDDARAPATRPFAEVVAHVLESAIANKEPMLAADWYSLGPHILLPDLFQQSLKKGDVIGNNPQTGKPMRAKAAGQYPREFTAEEADALPVVQRIRNAYWKSDAANQELDEDLCPPAEMRDPFEEWWWSPERV